ncbi:hypothetical protein D9M68_853180 [compost metagenome]
MQVSEQGVFGTQPRALGAQRFLDLDDQLRLVEHLRRVPGDLRAGGLVVGVAEADGGPRLALDPDLMAKGGQFGYRLRSQADAVLMVLELFGDTDTHDPLLHPAGYLEV